MEGRKFEPTPPEFYPKLMRLSDGRAVVHQMRNGEWRYVYNNFEVDASSTPDHEASHVVDLLELYGIKPMVEDLGGIAVSATEGHQDLEPIATV